MMTKFGQNFAKELTWVLYIIACVVINLWPETYSLKLRPECIMPKGNLPSHPRHRDLRTPQLVSPRETTPTGPNPNPKMDIPPPWFPTAVSSVPGQRGGGGLLVGRAGLGARCVAPRRRAAAGEQLAESRPLLLLEGRVRLVQLFQLLRHGLRLDALGGDTSKGHKQGKQWPLGSGGGVAGMKTNATDSVCCMSCVDYAINYME